MFFSDRMCTSSDDDVEMKDDYKKEDIGDDEVDGMTMTTKIMIMKRL